MLLEELLNLYVSKRLRAASPNTLRLYRHSIGSLAKSIGREPTLDDLNDETIERHMWRIVQNGGSVASANKDRGQLIAIWRFASEKRMIDRWPDVRAMPEPERVPMGWMPDEIHRLFEAIGRQQGKFAGVPCSLWWSSLIRVLLDTGERIGAIRNLTKDALQDRWLMVPAHLRKGRKRERLYPLTPETIADLRALIAANKADKRLFPWERTESYLYNLYKKLLEAADLPTDRRSKFHRIRRTVASAVAREGGDASAALDHSSPRTTKKYLDPRIVGQEPVASVLARYLANPGLAQKTDTPNRNAG
jgi:integrase